MVDALWCSWHLAQNNTAAVCCISSSSCRQQPPLTSMAAIQHLGLATTSLLLFRWVVAHVCTAQFVTAQAGRAWCVPRGDVLSWLVVLSGSVSVLCCQGTRNITSAHLLEPQQSYEDGFSLRSHISTDKQRVQGSSPQRHSALDDHDMHNTRVCHPSCSVHQGTPNSSHSCPSQTQGTLNQHMHCPTLLTGYFSLNRHSQGCCQQDASTDLVVPGPQPVQIHEPSCTPHTLCLPLAASQRTQQAPQRTTACVLHP